MAIPVKSKTTRKGTLSGTAHGGDGHMFGQSGAVQAKPEALVTHGSGGGNWAKGGPSGQMVGKQSAKPAKAC